MGNCLTKFGIKFKSINSVDIEKLPPIRFIHLKDFQSLDLFPRFPNNKDLIVELEDIDYENSFVVFISHCWLSGYKEVFGWYGKPHPDNENGDKFKLCCEGIQKIKDNLAPDMKDCYIWLDFGCMNQDVDPAGELKLLDKIVQACDCIFTPIHTPNTNTGTVVSNWYSDYTSDAWNSDKYSYIHRGWCRVEMFYASNIPIIINDKRLLKFKYGLKYSLSTNRRIHFLYGITESKKNNAQPIILPPLRNSYFTEFDPCKGNVTKPSDKKKIIELVQDLKKYMTFAEVGYIGVLEYGKKNGKGIYTFPNGDVYTGNYKDNMMHGAGVFEYSSGNKYTGNYYNNKKHGLGKFHFSNGNFYEGNYKFGLRNGHGVFTFSSGDTYIGNFKENEMNGQGMFKYATGDVYNGTWKDGKMHGKGICTLANGDVYNGCYTDGKKNGHGIFTYANGNIFHDGLWKDDNRVINQDEVRPAIPVMD